MQHLQVTVKIIPYSGNRVIGWKGNILEVGLTDPSTEGLEMFLASQTCMPQEAIMVAPLDGHNLFSVDFVVKHLEDPAVFFSL